MLYSVLGLVLIVIFCSDGGIETTSATEKQVRLWFSEFRTSVRWNFASNMTQKFHFIFNTCIQRVLIQSRWWAGTVPGQSFMFEAIKSLSPASPWCSKQLRSISCPLCSEIPEFTPAVELWYSVLWPASKHLSLSCSTFSNHNYTLKLAFFHHLCKITSSIWLSLPGFSGCLTKLGTVR